MRLRSAKRDARQVAVRREYGVQEAAVSATGDPDDSHAAVLYCGHHHLRVEGALQLIGQSQPHATHRLERRLLRLRLGKRYQLGASPHSVQETAQIVLDRADLAGLK